MPADNALVERVTEQLTKVDMVYRSADWKERIVNIAKNSGSIVQNTPNKVKPLRLKGMECDHEPVVKYDVAFVHGAAEK